MRSIICLLFIISLPALSHAQQGSLNKLDSAGKKDGKWVVYLDKDWKTLKDSADALYYRYTYYEHGTNIIPMGPCGGKNFKLEIRSNSAQPTGKIKLLDGEYKWYDDKGRLSSTHVLKNGEYISCKEYYRSGELNQHFDYTKKCEGQPHSWAVLIYDKKGNLILESYTCRDKNGSWPKMRG